MRGVQQAWTYLQMLAPGLSEGLGGAPPCSNSWVRAPHTHSHTCTHGSVTLTTCMAVPSGKERDKLEAELVECGKASKAIEDEALKVGGRALADGPQQRG